MFYMKIKMIKQKYIFKKLIKLIKKNLKLIYLNINLSGIFYLIREKFAKKVLISGDWMNWDNKVELKNVDG